MNFQYWILHMGSQVKIAKSKLVFLWCVDLTVLENFTDFSFSLRVYGIVSFE